jgi:hypothetical protein
VANWLGDVLFGSEGELQTQQLSTLTPEQNSLMRVLIQQLGGVGGGRAPTGMAPRGGRASQWLQAAGMGPPEGELDIAGGNFLSEAENTSLAGLEERAMLRATGGLEAESQGALKELIQGRGGVGGFDEFFKTNVLDPSLKDFQEKIQPAISRGFGGSSFFSSERAQADRNAGQDLMETITRERGRLSLEDRQASAQRMLAAIGLAPEIDRVGTETRIKELGAFGTERGARNERINQLLALLGTRGVENLGGMTSGQTGLVQGFVGGLGQGLGSSLSDRRAKTNITRVGETKSGIPLYRFNYFGDRISHIGVMADEVEHIPDAVHTIRGVKYVDYSKVV